MTRAEALTLANELAPRLRARAEEAEHGRRMPHATLDDYKQTGLLKLMQPARHGGHELGWDVFNEVTEILAAACGAQAWVYRVLADHNKMLGTFSAEAQEDVWGKDDNAQASSSFAPVGKTQSQTGGYVLSGNYSFSSGIDHAQWVLLGGMITEGPRAPGPHFFLVPRDAGTIIDDWHVTGLEGTGSKSFKIENAFVPDHRILSMADSVAAKGPGTLINTAPVFRLPRYSYTGSGFSALMTGMAQGLFNDWQDHMMAKRGDGGAKATDSEYVQMTAATAAAEIDAARNLYLPGIREVMVQLARGERTTKAQDVKARRNNSYACQLALNAGNRMYSTFGGRGVYRGNALERQHRNLLVASQHVSINWPSSAAGYAKQLFES